MWVRAALRGLGCGELVVRVRGAGGVVGGKDGGEGGWEEREAGGSREEHVVILSVRRPIAKVLVFNVGRKRVQNGSRFVS